MPTSAMLSEANPSFPTPRSRGRDQLPRPSPSPAACDPARHPALSLQPRGSPAARGAGPSGGFATSPGAGDGDGAEVGSRVGVRFRAESSRVDGVLLREELCRCFVATNEPNTPCMPYAYIDPATAELWPTLDVRHSSTQV